MKKTTSGVIVLLATLLLAACASSSSLDSTTSEDTSSDTSTSIDSLSSEEETSLAPSSTSETLSSSIVEVSSVSSSEGEPLANEELSFLSNSSYYGNTNGNASNKGLVVYDWGAQLHYFAIGGSVYSYHPLTQVTALLFSLSDGGDVRNLCLAEGALYFVSTNSLHMLRYDMASEAIETISTNETYYISRYDDYVYANMTKTDYQTNGLGIYRHDTSAFLTNFSSGTTNVNISGTKLIFNTDNGPIIQVMASNFLGKTTLKNFTDQGLIEIEQMHLISEGYSSPYPRLIAFIGHTSSQMDLYLYNSGEDTLITLASGANINSLNSDGANLYYINDRALYKYNLDTASGEKIINLNQDSKYLYVINHWLYFSNDAMNTVSRINPDTKLIENNIV